MSGGEGKIARSKLIRGDSPVLATCELLRLSP
jgi:hypothetical protein